ASIARTDPEGSVSSDECRVQTAECRTNGVLRVVPKKKMEGLAVARVEPSIFSHFASRAGRKTAALASARLMYKQLAAERKELLMQNLCKRAVQRAARDDEKSCERRRIIDVARSD